MAPDPAHGDALLDVVLGRLDGLLECTSELGPAALFLDNHHIRQILPLGAVDPLPSLPVRSQAKSPGNEIVYLSPVFGSWASNRPNTRLPETAGSWKLHWALAPNPNRQKQ